MLMQNIRTNNKVTFGLRLPNSGPFATAETVLAASEEADTLGYDILWLHDHISWTDDMRNHFAAGSLEAWIDQKPNFYESLTTASFIGSRTTRATVGISGLVVSLRDPRVLARQILTIYALCEGKLTYAIGIGGVENDFDVLEIPWKERGRIADEHLQALDAMFKEETLSSFHGDRVNFDNAGFFPKPKGIKRWVVGGSKAALRRVSNFGDGWLVAHETPQEFSSHMDFLTSLLDQKGRSIDDCVCGPEIFTAVEDSYEEAYRIVAPALGDRLGAVEESINTSAFGTSEQVSGKLQAYIDAGATHIEFKIIALNFNHYMRTVRRIANEVIPTLKG